MIIILSLQCRKLFHVNISGFLRLSNAFKTTFNSVNCLYIRIISDILTCFFQRGEYINNILFKIQCFHDYREIFLIDRKKTNPKRYAFPGSGLISGLQVFKKIICIKKISAVALFLHLSKKAHGTNYLAFAVFDYLNIIDFNLKLFAIKHYNQVLALQGVSSFIQQKAG